MTWFKIAVIPLASFYIFHLFSIVYAIERTVFDKKKEEIRSLVHKSNLNRYGRKKLKKWLIKCQELEKDTSVFYTVDDYQFIGESWYSLIFSAYSKTQIYESQSDFDSMKYFYQKAISLSTTNISDIEIGFAKKLLTLNKLEQAEIILRELIAIGNHNKFDELFALLGNINQMRRDFTNAEEFYNKSLNINPYNKNSLIGAVQIHTSKLEFQDALVKIKIGLTAYPNDVELLNLFTVCTHSEYEYQETFLRLQSEPGNIVLVNKMAGILIGMGSWDLALQHLEKYYNDGIYDSLTLFYLGQMCLNKHPEYCRERELSMISLFKNAIENQPVVDISNILLNLAFAYEVDGANVMAENTYKNIISRFPDFLPAYIGLYNLYSKLGLENLAENYKRKALQFIQ